MFSSYAGHLSRMKLRTSVLGSLRQRTSFALIGWAAAGALACSSTTTPGEDPSGGSGSGSVSGGSGGTNSGSAGQSTGSGGVTTGVSGASPGSGGSPGTAGAPAGSGGTATGTGGSAPGSGGSPVNTAGTGGKGGTAGTGGTTATPMDFYIGPNGNDLNAGTMAAPFKTPARAHQFAIAGSTIWVLPGTYNFNFTVGLTKKGTATSPIRFWAAPGTRPIFNFAQLPRDADASRGIELTGDYWHIRGLEIENAGDNGMDISGSHNTIENVVLHNNGDTGLQITVPSQQETDNTRGAFNTILNCDSFLNFDAATGGENADGFAAKLAIGPGNVFRGCRSWNNADDGWDLFAANDVVVIDGCWAFLNGKGVAGNNPAGDGNGFKLGGAPEAGNPAQGGAVHQVTGNSAFENLACGFVRNNNPSNPALSNCKVRANPNGDYCNVTCSGSGAESTTGAAAKAIARNADGSLPALP